MNKSTTDKWQEYHLTVKQHNGGGVTIRNYRGTMDEFISDAKDVIAANDIPELYEMYELWGNDEIDDAEFVTQVFAYDCNAVSFRRVMTEQEIREWIRLHGKHQDFLSDMERSLVRRDLEHEDYIEVGEPVSNFLVPDALVFSGETVFPEDVEDYLEGVSDWIVLCDTRILNCKL